MDPNNLFDLSKLNDDELGQLEFLLLSPAWQGFLMQYLALTIRGIEKMMKDRTKERKERYNDDFLAGQCVALESFVAFCMAASQNISMARVAEAQRLTPEQEYDRLRATGFIRHSGQVQRAEELTPLDEDY